MDASWTRQAEPPPSRQQLCRVAEDDGERHDRGEDQPAVLRREGARPLEASACEWGGGGLEEGDGLVSLLQWPSVISRSPSLSLSLIMSPPLGK